MNPWDHHQGMSVLLLLSRLRTLFRINFAVRAVRENMLSIMDTITEDSTAIVNANSRFPDKYIAVTSSGHFAALLGSLYDNLTFVNFDNTEPAQRSAVQLSFRKTLMRAVDVLVHSGSDVSLAHMVHNRDSFEEVYGLRWQSKTFVKVENPTSPSK